MSILFGTDFSEPAAKAARAAATLAARCREPLILAHVLDTTEPDSMFGTEPVSMKPLRRRLHEEAQRLSALGVEVKEELLVGIPDEVLVGHAEKVEARLIVLSALGRRSRTCWQLGSTAERVAQASKVPVLVVRDLESFEAWTEGRRPLKMVLAYDFTTVSDAALSWTEGMRALGPCDVTVTYVYWPPEQHSRLGILTPMDLIKNEPQIEEILLRDLQRSIGKLEGTGEICYQVLFSMGRLADPLAALAEEQKADLLVVGSHQRRGLSKLWHGSAAQGVLHHAPCSVAVVPGKPAARQKAMPRIQKVLVPTDLSETSSQAIPHAFSALSAGGCVHLLHVLERSSSIQALAALRQRLEKALTPAIAEEAARRGILVETEIVEDPSPAKAICQAAERLGVDVICMATHGRSGISRVIAGSIAQEVMGTSRLPLLLLRPQTEV